MVDARIAEEQFYSQYSWCLNPALPLEDLLCRFQEELDRYAVLSGWQREEARTNIFLFACGIACTVDDWLAQHWLNLLPLSSRFPQVRSAIERTQRLVDRCHAFTNVGRPAVCRWRRRWDVCLAHVCRFLSNDQDFEDLRRISAPLLNARLPEAVLRQRMRLPEAFRAQDMTHQDVVTLIGRFCDAQKPDSRPLVIVGLRTAGAYFAPLMTECLRSRNWTDVSWFSIRPKNGIAPHEGSRLRKAARTNAHVLLVDDYPSTGHTIRVALHMLGQWGIGPHQIAVLAPTHPASPDWVKLANVDPQIPVFTIYEHELQKRALLAPDAAASLCADYYEADEIRPVPSTDVDAINQHLAEHSKDGHHVREKRLFTFELRHANGETATKKVLLKSVGWGWLGYHAYIAGNALEGFVPRVRGLRNGLLIMDWLEGPPASSHSSASPEVVEAVASYVAARATRVRVKGDCRFESRTYRWTGIDDMLEILRAVYGPYLNQLKRPGLRKQVQRYVTALPTLIDGRMRPEEWIHSSTGFVKTDFEHHNFGGGEQDLVDPAYDLAAAMFEFDLSKDAQQEMLRIYQEKSGDASIHERILLQKLLYGTTIMRHSPDAIASGKEPIENNARCQRARNFLVYAMTDFCRNFLNVTKGARWNDHIVVLDIDGIFDQELLGFPHATQSALQSLALLHANDLSVLLNTGRSAQHVRNYCEAYGLAGGIAEYGAVFIDAVHNQEIALVDKHGSLQLARCRDALQELPGVFIDATYEYAIRAYRYKGRATTALAGADLNEFLNRPEFSLLTHIDRGSDTCIVQRRTSQGAALRFVRRHIHAANPPIAAIGVSPAALLAFVRDQVKRVRKSSSRKIPELAAIEAMNGLMLGLLKAADRSWWNF